MVPAVRRNDSIIVHTPSPTAWSAEMGMGTVAEMRIVCIRSYFLAAAPPRHPTVRVAHLLG